MYGRHITFKKILAQLLELPSPYEKHIFEKKLLSKTPKLLYSQTPRQRPLIFLFRLVVPKHSISEHHQFLINNFVVPWAVLREEDAELLVELFGD